MRTDWKLAFSLAAALSLSLPGCGGSPEIGDAVVTPPGGAAPAPDEKPAETPSDEVDPSVEPGQPPRTAPEPEAPAAP